MHILAVCFFFFFLFFFFLLLLVVVVIVVVVVVVNILKYITDGEGMCVYMYESIYRGGWNESVSDS